MNQILILNSILNIKFYTNNTALIQPSISGLLVTCAYLPQTILPPGVTKPNSLTLTSIIVPFVMIPNDEYKLECGFFFTAIISKQKVVFNSGCVTCAFLNLNAAGRIKRSNFGGLRVKCGGTNVTFSDHTFPCFFFYVYLISIL